jgi:hypothetical protein
MLMFFVQFFLVLTAILIGAPAGRPGSCGIGEELPTRP